MDDLVEIRNVLNANRHLDCTWIIFTRAGEVYFHGAPKGEALTPEEAKAVAEEYESPQPIN